MPIAWFYILSKSVFKMSRTFSSSSDNDPGVSLIDKFLKKKSAGGKDDEVRKMFNPVN